MNGRRDIDIRELIALLVEECAKAVLICQNGERTDEDIYELYMTLQDFNHTPEHRVMQKPPKQVPATESKGFHIKIEQTRFRKGHGQPAAPKAAQYGSDDRPTDPPSDAVDSDQTAAVDLPMPKPTNGSGVQHYHFGGDKPKNK